MRWHGPARYGLEATRHVETNVTGAATVLPDHGRRAVRLVWAHLR